MPHVDGEPTSDRCPAAALGGRRKRGQLRGRVLLFNDVCIYPKPHDASTLPIHIGGSTSASARRAGLRGDGISRQARSDGDERLRQIDLMRVPLPRRSRCRVRRHPPGFKDPNAAAVEARGRPGDTAGRWPGITGSAGAARRLDGVRGTRGADLGPEHATTFTASYTAITCLNGLPHPASSASQGLRATGKPLLT